MVAVVIASLVVVAAHRIFTGVADGSRVVATARAALDQKVNARRWLKATFLSLEPPFEGRVNRATFTSWQMVSDGWFEPQPTALALEGSRFLATSGHQTLQLGDSVV